MSEATYATNSFGQAGKILAVEDDNTSRAILIGLLEDLGYDTIEAANGKEALAVIEREAENIDIIVLDKVMPEMDGLEVVEHLKEDLTARHIPVVMVTGSKSPEEVQEGIDAGVYYYMTKPYEDNVFESVMNAAMGEVNKRKILKTELKKHQVSFGFIDRAEFTIKTVEEAESLACFLANCFPSPDTALPGLVSLVVNAVEHGSLDIGYAEKTQLLKSGKLSEEIKSRQNKSEYADKFVKVSLEKNEGETRVTITDQGNGFNWQEFMEVDPARALDSHGRGIAQANKISFDELSYNEKGNRVIAVSRSGSGIKW